MKLSVHDVIERPIVTEKSAIAREASNVATFRVDPKASKHDIRRAVEQLFNVKVESVNTMLYRGKDRRMGRGYAKMQNWKKAIITLREGSSIDFFDASES